MHRPDAKSQSLGGGGGCTHPIHGLPQQGVGSAGVGLSNVQKDYLRFPIELPNIGPKCRGLSDCGMSLASPTLVGREDVRKWGFQTQEHKFAKCLMHTGRYGDGAVVCRIPWISLFVREGDLGVRPRNRDCPRVPDLQDVLI